MEEDNGFRETDQIQDESFEDENIEQPDSDISTESMSPPDDIIVSWQEREYISTEKGTLWYIIFGIVVLGLLALSIFVMNAPTFALVIVFSVIALFIYFRTARTINYALGNKGLHIEDKVYPYSGFKSFGVLDDGKSFSIVFIPKKRFSPGVSVLIPEDKGEQIVDVLGRRIPMEEVKLDLIDKILKGLRF
jgi:hypothetical protein